MASSIERIFRKNPLWPQVKKAALLCVKKGYPSYIVGGALRDALLNKTPQDFDIASSARPKELLKIFPRAHYVGKAFGVLYLPLRGGRGVEIAAFRKEGPYLDGRRPSKVEFCSIEEDAGRRDFTINALYYDIEKKEVIDFKEGLKDIRKKQIKTVGPPQKRFKEDKLRMMRAVRFSAMLGFDIEKKTFETLKKNISSIHQIAKERVINELEKIGAAGDFERAFILFTKIRFFPLLWPSYSWRMSPLWKRQKKCLCLFCRKKRDVLFFWILLFVPFIKEGQKALPLLSRGLREAGLPSQTIKNILRFFSFKKMMLSKARAGAKLRMLAYPRSDIYFQILYHILSVQKKLEQRKNLIQMKKHFEKLTKGRGHLPSPFLKGGDFLKAGVKKGPMISKWIDLFYDDQLEGRIQSRPQALKILKRISS